MATKKDAITLQTLAKQVAALSAAVAGNAGKTTGKPAAKAKSGNPQVEEFIREIIGEVNAGKYSAESLIPLCARPEKKLAEAATVALPKALKTLDLAVMEKLLATAAVGNPARRIIAAAVVDLHDYMAGLNRLAAARQKK